MILRIELDDEYVNGLIQEGCEVILKQYSPSYIEGVIETRAKGIVDDVMSKYINESEKEIEDLCREKIKDNLYITIDRIVARLNQDSAYRGTKKVMGDAIRDIIYNEKEKIVEEVVRRAADNIQNIAKKDVRKEVLKEILEGQA